MLPDIFKIGGYFNDKKDIDPNVALETILSHKNTMIVLCLEGMAN